MNRMKSFFKIVIALMLFFTCIGSVSAESYRVDLEDEYGFSFEATEESIVITEKVIRNSDKNSQEYSKFKSENMIAYVVRPYYDLKVYDDGYIRYDSLAMCSRQDAKDLIHEKYEKDGTILEITLYRTSEASFIIFSQRPSGITSGATYFALLASDHHLIRFDLGTFYDKFSTQHSNKSFLDSITLANQPVASPTPEANVDEPSDNTLDDALDFPQILLHSLISLGCLGLIALGYFLFKKMRQDKSS